MAKIKKGDRRVYTGKYAWQMPEVFGPVEPFDPYPPGVVIGFRNNRFHGPSIIVALENDEGTEAEWPIAETRPAPTEGQPLSKGQT